MYTSLIFLLFLISFHSIDKPINQQLTPFLLVKYSEKVPGCDVMKKSYPETTDDDMNKIMGIILRLNIIHMYILLLCLGSDREVGGLDMKDTVSFRHTMNFIFSLTLSTVHLAGV